MWHDAILSLAIHGGVMWAAPESWFTVCCLKHHALSWLRAVVPLSTATKYQCQHEVASPSCWGPCDNAPSWTTSMGLLRPDPAIPLV